MLGGPRGCDLSRVITSVCVFLLLKTNQGLLIGFPFACDFFVGDFFWIKLLLFRDISIRTRRKYKEIWEECTVYAAPVVIQVLWVNLCNSQHGK